MGVLHGLSATSEFFVLLIIMHSFISVSLLREKCVIPNDACLLCMWTVPPVIHQTFNTQWPCLSSGFGTCVEQPAVVCQECTVADDVPLRAKDCTFPVVIWQWIDDRDCTAQYNCCLPTTTDCWRFCRFVFLFLLSFFLILYGAPAMSLTW